MIAGYCKRTAKLVFGLFLFAVGSFLGIQANIGLAPWEAFSMGVSYHTGLSYGDVVMFSGLIILVIDFMLKEKLGFGTVLNTLLIGKFTDLIASWEVIPKMQGMLSGVLMMLAGQVILSLGSYFYIGSALGCGPRDALMVALGKRLPKISIGTVRSTMEGSVLALGWLLGAKVGLGTVISVFGIGFILQTTFKLLRFDVKQLKHESIADTMAIIAGRRQALYHK